MGDVDAPAGGAGAGAGETAKEEHDRLAREFSSLSESKQANMLEAWVMRELGGGSDEGVSVKTYLPPSYRHIMRDYKEVATSATESLKKHVFDPLYEMIKDLTEDQIARYDVARVNTLTACRRMLAAQWKRALQESNSHEFRLHHMSAFRWGLKRATNDFLDDVTSRAHEGNTMLLEVFGATEGSEWPVEEVLNKVESMCVTGRAAVYFMKKLQRQRGQTSLRQFISDFDGHLKDYGTATLNFFTKDALVKAAKAIGREDTWHLTPAQATAAKKPVEKKYSKTYFTKSNFIWDMFIGNVNEKTLVDACSLAGIHNFHDFHKEWEKAHQHPPVGNAEIVAAVRAIREAERSAANVKKALSKAGAGAGAGANAGKDKAKPKAIKRTRDTEGDKVPPGQKTRGGAGGGDKPRPKSEISYAWCLTCGKKDHFTVNCKVPPLYEGLVPGGQKKNKGVCFVCCKKEANHRHAECPSRPTSGMS